MKRGRAGAAIVAVAALLVLVAAAAAAAALRSPNAPPAAAPSAVAPSSLSPSSPPPPASLAVLATAAPGAAVPATAAIGGDDGTDTWDTPQGVPPCDPGSCDGAALPDRLTAPLVGDAQGLETAPRGRAFLFRRRPADDPPWATLENRDALVATEVPPSPPRVACLVAGFLRSFEATMDSCPVRRRKDGRNDGDGEPRRRRRPSVDGDGGDISGGDDDGGRRAAAKRRDREAARGECFGHLRRRVLDPLACDVFVSTWDIRGQGTRNTNRYDPADTVDPRAVIAAVATGGGASGKGDRAPRATLAALHVQRHAAYAPLLRNVERFPRPPLRQLVPAELSVGHEGVAGNIEWAPAVVAGARVVAARYTRTNEYAQVLKQFCAMQLVRHHELRRGRLLAAAAASQQTKPSTSPPVDPASVGYDFYFRLRPDLKARALLSPPRWQPVAPDVAAAAPAPRRERTAVFTVSRAPRGGGDVAARPMEKREHSVGPRRIHAQNGDLTDFGFLGRPEELSHLLEAVRSPLAAAPQATGDATVVPAPTPDADSTGDNRTKDAVGGGDTRFRRDPQRFVGGQWAELNLMSWFVVFRGVNPPWALDNGGGYLKIHRV